MPVVLDIELLRSFHAVARLKQFRAAAVQLHKSPAAISVHIQRLETIAGARLLERDNQGVALTAVGSRLLASSTELLAAHDRALAELQGTTAAGRVRFGVPDEYVVHVISDILPMFNAAWPNVVMEVTTAPSDELREQVAKGKLHMAVIAQTLGLRGDHQGVLQQTTPVWVCGSRLRLAEGEALPLALYASPCPYRDAMTHALDTAGIAWRVMLDTPSGAAVEASVEAGIGISAVDPWRLTPKMKIMDHLPALPAHDIVMIQNHSAADIAPHAMALLKQALQQRFRL